MLRHPPFQKLLRMLVVWSVAYGGVTAFTVVFLKSAAGLAEGSILYVSSVSFLGGLCSLWFLARALMGLAAGPSSHSRLRPGFWLLAGWTALAGGAMPFGLIIVSVLQFLWACLPRSSTCPTPGWRWSSSR